MAFFHLVPVDASTGRPRPEPASVGDYPKTGGFYAVRSADEVDTAKLATVIEATARTHKLAEGIFVTRSLLWGFPDIAHVWEEDGNVHVFSHLVYGRSDLGVNKKRVEAWLSAASK